MPTDTVPIQAANMKEPCRRISNFEAATRAETSDKDCLLPLARKAKEWKPTEVAIENNNKFFL